MVIGDPGHRLADGAGHTSSRPLRCGRGSSISTAQPDGTRELSKKEVPLGAGLGAPLAIADGVRLLDVVVDLGEASAVRLLGSCVEHLARVPQCRSRQARRSAAVGGCHAPDLGGDEIQHVELPARLGEEPCQVVHAFQVAHVDGVPVEGHRPVVAFATKHVGAGDRFLVA